VKHEGKGRKTGIHIKAEVTSSNPGENFFPEAAGQELPGGISTEVTSSNPGASTSRGCRTGTS
jgi:hypothetical protein